MNLDKTLAVCCCVMLCVAESGFAGGTIGRTVGVTCNACHGPDGKSEGAIPSLDELTDKQIESELLAFRSGKRPATIMNRIARGYTNNEIAAVAEYFSNLK